MFDFFFFIMYNSLCVQGKFTISLSVFMLFWIIKYETNYLFYYEYIMQRNDYTILYKINNRAMG